MKFRASLSENVSQFSKWT